MKRGIAAAVATVAIVGVAQPVTADAVGETRMTITGVDTAAPDRYDRTGRRGLAGCWFWCREGSPVPGPSGHWPATWSAPTAASRSGRSTGGSRTVAALRATSW
ncbi:hypothetical protein [Spirillospora sp. CA-294931]|uniref:hypothetical protein n=1 Tax=Spirillospora sp. CA-294931 TaxID=3240042 RepID=UPI003D907668